MAAFAVGIVAILATVVLTARKYRSLPATVNMQPDYGVMGQRMPRPAIWLLPLVQIALLAVWFFFRTSSNAPDDARDGYVKALAGTDLILFILLASQYWLIRQAVNDAD